MYGEPYITDVLCGIKVRLSALSFYQVNHAMAERLYNKAAEFAGKGGTLIDLYCGAGTISLCASKYAGKVVGIEIVEKAVENAKKNAERNNVKNAEFYCGDAGKTGVG